MRFEKKELLAPLLQTTIPMEIIERQAVSLLLASVLPVHVMEEISKASAVPLLPIDNRFGTLDCCRSQKANQSYCFDVNCYAVPRQIILSFKRLFEKTRVTTNLDIIDLKEVCQEIKGAVQRVRSMSENINSMN